MIRFFWWVKNIVLLLLAFILGTGLSFVFVLVLYLQDDKLKQRLDNYAYRNDVRPVIQLDLGGDRGLKKARPVEVRGFPTVYGRVQFHLVYHLPHALGFCGRDLPRLTPVEAVTAIQKHAGCIYERDDGWGNYFRYSFYEGKIYVNAIIQ